MGFWKKILGAVGIGAGIAVTAKVIKESKKKRNKEKKELEEKPEFFCPKCEADLTKQKGFDPKRSFWKCIKCGQNLYGDDVYDGERFPGVMWHCDECGALLNKQEGFSDIKSSWRCKGCGHINYLSSSEINDYEDDEDYYEDSYEENLNNSCIDCGSKISNNDEFCLSCWERKFSLKEYEFDSLVSEFEDSKNDLENEFKMFIDIVDKLSSSIGSCNFYSLENYLEELSESVDKIKEIRDDIYNNFDGVRTKEKAEEIIDEFNEIKSKYNSIYNCDLLELKNAIEKLKWNIDYEKSNKNYKPIDDWDYDGYMCSNCLRKMKEIPSDCLCYYCKSEYLSKLEEAYSNIDSILSRINSIFNFVILY